MDQAKITTYQAVVYQSKANRAIKNQYDQVLREHGITSMQWSILGFINDAGANGIRVSDLADKLGTSLAFITNSINVLEKKSVVKRKGNNNDSRSKLICLTPTYQAKFDTIEKQLSKTVDAWLSKLCDKGELSVYKAVLRKLATDK